MARQRLIVGIRSMPELCPAAAWLSPILLLLILGLLLRLVLASPQALALDQSECFSCRIEINSLKHAKSLEGRWLFSRDDLKENALPETSTQDWMTVSTPGPWTKAYPDKELYRVGWYRGNFFFSDAMIGKKVVFYIDAYMSKMSVFVDGKIVFDRQGHDTHQRYYSIQPVPVVFEVTKAQHVIAVRIDTPLMVGVYQSPFQMREYSHYDPMINFFQIFCGELRYLFAYIFAWTGLFFLMLFFKTRYPLYLVAGLTGIGIFPFYAFPNDISVRLFSPDTMLILHYPGIGFMALGYFWFSQFFHKFYPRVALFNAITMGLFSLVFLYLAFDFHMQVFQIVRKALFLFAFAIATHGVYNCIVGYRKDPRIGPAIIGKVMFWLCSGHDILLALGVINSTSLIFVGTFAGTFAIMLITANLFAQTFNDNKKLLREVEIVNDGLERTVAERTKNLREKTQEISSILESLPQGIIEADSKLKVLGNFSQALTQILNTKDIEGHDLLELIFSGSNLSADAVAQARSALEMGLGESRFTFDVNAASFPSETIKLVGKDLKTLSIGWASMCDDEDRVEKILVTLTDITRQKKLEQESAALKLRSQIIEATLDSSSSRLILLVRQAQSKVLAVWNNPGSADVDPAMVYRELHTLKGNARLFELNELSNLCHVAESQLEKFKRNRSSPEIFKTLQTAMEEVLASIASLVSLINHFSEKIKDQHDPYGISVHPEMLSSLNRHSNAIKTDERLSGLIRALRYKPAQIVTVHLREQYKQLALGLGKPEAVFNLNVKEELFISPEFATTLMDMLGHMIRNSMDHGIEFPEVRQKLGKPVQGQIQLQLLFDIDEDAIVFQFADDGGGLDLKKIRQQAASLGLCSADENRVEAIVQCIFAPGFSTAKAVSEVSGRGVGMDVVLNLIKTWDGRMEWVGHPKLLADVPLGTVPFHVRMKFPSNLGYELAAVDIAS